MSSTRTSAKSEDAPPEVQATLSRLLQHKNVRGVLILSRPSGIILRSAGNLFSNNDPNSSHGPSSRVRPRLSQDNEDSSTAPKVDGDGSEGIVPVHSEIARKYAKMAEKIVETSAAEIGAVDDADDLKFLRLRTKKHELIITPDSQYILVVIQDPTL